MDNSILRKAAKQIWNKRNKIKVWSVSDLTRTSPSINTRTASVIFVKLEERKLMERVYVPKNNDISTMFRINANEEKEWECFISPKRIFDLPFLRIKKFYIKHWKWLISLSVSTILAFIGLCLAYLSIIKTK
jgi:hypothetical protein